MSAAGAKRTIYNYTKMELFETIFRQSSEAVIAMAFIRRGASKLDAIFCTEFLQNGAINAWNLA